jgi:hypothetical protein
MLRLAILLVMLLAPMGAAADQIGAPPFIHQTERAPVPMAADTHEVEAGKEAEKPERVLEVRPTRDPQPKTSLIKHIGKSAVVVLSVNLLVGAAKVGLAVLGVPIF